MSKVITGTSPSPLIPAFPLKTGRYYGFPHAAATSTSAVLGNGNLRSTPFYVPNSVTLATLGAEITSAGDAGSTLRLGIYTDDGTGRPGSLVVDAGTIAADSATVQEIACTTKLQAGLYHSVAVVQGVVTTQPTVRVINVATIFGSDWGGSIPTAGQNTFGFINTGVTAALPAAYTVQSISGTMARIFTKIG